METHFPQQLFLKAREDSDLTILSKMGKTIEGKKITLYINYLSKVMR